jgi:hypothetical protein
MRSLTNRDDCADSFASKQKYIQRDSAAKRNAPPFLGTTVVNALRSRVCGGERTTWSPIRARQAMRPSSRLGALGVVLALTLWPTAGYPKARLGSHIEGGVGPHHKGGHAISGVDAPVTMEKHRVKKKKSRPVDICNDCLKLEFNGAGQNMAPNPDVLPSSPPTHKKKSRRASPPGDEEVRRSPPEGKEAAPPSPSPLRAVTSPRPTETECNAHAAENVRLFREALRALNAGTVDSAAMAQHTVFNLCMAGKPEREAFAETMRTLRGK